MNVQPLQFDEVKGQWSWPPRQPNGKRVMQGKVADMELILAQLAEHGPYESASGTAGTALYKESGYDKTGGAFNNVLGDLDDLGLIDRVVRGKRTMRLALTVPTEELPDSIVARLAKTNGHSVQEDLEVAQRIIDEPEPAPEPLHVTAPDQGEGLDMSALASFLLDEVVRRATQEPDEELALAPLRAERENLANKVKSLQRQLDNANKDLDEERKRAKGLRASIMSRDDQIKALEANLQTAVDAAREWYQRHGQTEETRKNLERLMKQVPGFTREV